MFCSLCVKARRAILTVLAVNLGVALMALYFCATIQTTVIFNICIALSSIHRQFSAFSPQIIYLLVGRCLSAVRAVHWRNITMKCTHACMSLIARLIRGI